jgi:hypothetical protein
MASTALDDLVLEARRLNADQIKLLVQVARAMHGDQTKPPYDRSKDPAINLFDGDEDLSEREPYDPAEDGTIGSIDGLPADFAERSEELIKELTQKRGAWTQKDED